MVIANTPPAPSPDPLNDFHIVAIGASAGGLEALESFFSALPDSTGMAYIVIQHLSPDFKSHMDELLQRCTGMDIFVAQSNMLIKPDTVYLMPPRSEMGITDNRLQVNVALNQLVPHPIDHLFCALAEEHGDLSIAVVLSGTGSDGSEGIVDIDQVGGYVCAQDPETCKFAGMPTSAIATGVVKATLPPDEIARSVLRYQQNRLRRKSSAGDIAVTESQLSQPLEPMTRLLSLLRDSLGVDFAKYKSSTVGRRVQRRIDYLRLKSLDAYLEHVSENSAELDALFADLLIGVTHFFRDTEAFDCFEKSIIPKLIENAKQRSTLRIWIAGCATGEEAYSIAMLLDEARNATRADLDFKIFATDINPISLQHAAAGAYPPEAFGNLSLQRRDRYFYQKHETFHVNPELRKRIVFAPHNLIADTPFTQMDLVSCRNLLIYLLPEAQKTALSMFHFALKSNGVLWLGPSESPGDLASEFNVLDKHWRFYSKRRNVRLPLESPPVPSPAQSASVNSGISLLGIYDQLLKNRMPPSILVDHNLKILHVFGGAEAFLQPRAGRPSDLLLDCIVAPLATPLVAAIEHALRKKTTVQYADIAFQMPDGDHQVNLKVEPVFESRSQNETLLIEIETVQDGWRDQGQHVSLNYDDVTHQRVADLESRLEFSQENLQATIEEMETSNEELQASNEELIASNEELQSTNEELHSVNEELYSVNTEHQRRVEELAIANDDMDNLLATTRVGVLFLDDQLHIRRFTPDIGRIFHLMPRDVGRSIEDFQNHLQHENFIADLRKVIETKKELETHIQDNGGGHYLLRILPYLTLDQVNGVVLSLIDITTLTEAQTGLERFKFMTESSGDFISLIDREGKFLYVNPQMSDQLGFEQDELLALGLIDIDDQLDQASYDSNFDDAVSHTRQPYRSQWLRKDQSLVPVEVSLSDFIFNDKHYLCANARDISTQIETERELQVRMRAMESAKNGILISDATKPGNPTLYINPGFMNLTGYREEDIIGKNCRILQGPDTDPEQVLILRNAINSGTACRATLLNYRKDGTPFWNELQITPVHDNDGNLISFIGIQSDVSDRIEAENLLRQEAQRTEAILDTTAEGIYGVTDDGVCTFCNRATLLLLGYERDEELVGKKIHPLIQYADADGTPYPDDSCGINNAIKLNAKAHVDTEVFWRKDGTSFPVEYWIRPLIREGEIEGSVISFQNIQQQVQVKQKQIALVSRLEHTSRAARRSNETKSEFLANMSHEIRTPMSSIIGYSEILSRHLTDPDDLNCVEIIRNNGMFLLDIINDILDISKIEAGKIELVKEPFRIDCLVQDLRALLDLRAQEKGLKLSVKPKGNIPKIVNSDAKRLKQILLNLLGNAIKFTQHGEVCLTIEHLKDRTQRSRLKFAVSDTGIGLSEEQIAKLFQPFIQADASVDRKFGGTGLGLAISQRLAESLGGTISIVSALDEGSTFSFEIAIGNVDPNELVGAEGFDFSKSASLPAPTSNIKLKGAVLVVDDRREVRFIAQQYLEEVGASVWTADNGRQCLEMVHQAHQTGDDFDLVIMDMQMPVLDGYQATKELRGSGFEFPVIALTAHAMEGDRETCLEAGCTHYLTKPLVKHEFLTLVSNCLKQQSRFQKQPQANLQKVLIVDDGIDAANALKTILEMDGHTVEVAYDGISGLKRGRSMRPDYVLLDIALPGRNGVEVMNQLKKDLKDHWIQFIAVTGNENGAEILSRGFDHYMMKPVDLAALQKILKQPHNVVLSKTDEGTV